jgi:enoyl-CoA hydratase/3-hydroxyacyl-CoA dehydrogenase
MQLPEITLGIVPGIGAMVVPYRRWPKASSTFHDMLLTAKKLKAKEAHAIGMVDELVNDLSELVPAAIRMVKLMTGTKAHISEGPVEISDITVDVNESVSGQLLSRQIVEIIANTVRTAAAASSFAEALDMGYNAFGESALTAAAKEGIGAFLERRQPDFGKTG